MEGHCWRFSFPPWLSQVIYHKLQPASPLKTKALWLTGPTALGGRAVTGWLGHIDYLTLPLHSAIQSALAKGTAANGSQTGIWKAHVYSDTCLQPLLLLRQQAQANLGTSERHMEPSQVIPAEAILEQPASSWPVSRQWPWESHSEISWAPPGSTEPFINSWKIINSYFGSQVFRLATQQ